MTRILLVGLVAVAATIGLTLAWRSLRSPAPSHELAAEAAIAPEVVKGLFLARGCVNCHNLDNPLVGPSFAAIAERYRDEPQAEQVLLASLRQGSQGRWGATAMPVQRVGSISDEEATAMIRWILEQGAPSASGANDR